ncbi:MAG: hypothetical protein AVDCRST_MAG54-2233 [uncultured Actinomycetospora sp.]|uniref:Uncharacterized protein n=1 Tax=uncultured Actinomycetospora sp. TaxID=1135996 RepID=A0A6J4IPR3_9PSEU|nr:MAG: hypothetical protein AVDCRST_MAG54-2233 [uncultured Actinomycetospora sp.]
MAIVGDVEDRAVGLLRATRAADAQRPPAGARGRLVAVGLRSSAVPGVLGGGITIGLDTRAAGPAVGSPGQGSVVPRCGHVWSTPRPG